MGLPNERSSNCFFSVFFRNARSVEDFFAGSFYFSCGAGFFRGGGGFLKVMKEQHRVVMYL